MEPAVDRVRQNVGAVIVVLVFAGLLGGVAFLGRIVGDALGTAAVPADKGADELPPLPTQPGLAVGSPTTPGSAALPPGPNAARDAARQPGIRK